MASITMAAVGTNTPDACRCIGGIGPGGYIGGWTGGLYCVQAGGVCAGCCGGVGGGICILGTRSSPMVYHKTTTYHQKRADCEGDNQQAKLAVVVQPSGLLQPTRIH